MNPLLYSISCQQWQLFVTLTFESEDEFGNRMNVPIYSERRNMLFAFLRETAKGNKRKILKKRITRDAQSKRIESIPFSSLLWVAREERGERHGRYHFHILLSGLPLSRINTVERYSIKSIWASYRAGGFVDCRPFDTSLDGCRYVLKGLNNWSRQLANAYEASKFDDGQDRELILADACMQKWQRESRQRGRTSRTSSTVITGTSLADCRKMVVNRIKQAPYLPSVYQLNGHPAGVSFVR